MNQKSAENASVDKKVKETKDELKGGSVLADQVLEPLRAMLDAFEARLKPRLKPNQTLEERMRAYPDPNLETKRLGKFSKR